MLVESLYSTQAKLDALLGATTTPERVEAEQDAEAARWQDRIATVIVNAGLTLIDPSGNESGDPVDWTADQVGAALMEAGTFATRTGAEEAALHVERHSCVSTCCDANPSANEAKALAECIRAHGRRT